MHESVWEHVGIAVTGTMLAFTGLLCLALNGFSDPSDMEEWGFTVSYIVFFIGGLYLVIHSDVTHEHGVTVIGIVLGTSLILCNISLDPMNDRMFILKFLEFSMGVLIVILSATFLLDFRYNILEITRILLFLLALDLTPILLEWFLGIPLIETLDYYLSTVMISISYAATLCLLSTDGIRVVSQTTRLERNIERLEELVHSDGQEYITPEDLERILDPHITGWKRYDDGPLEGEVDVKLWNGVSCRKFTARRWRDTKGLTLEFDCEGEECLSDHLMFKVCKAIVSEDGSKVVFYSLDGFFITILVDDVRLGNSAVTNTYRVLSKSELNGYRKRPAK